MRFRRRVFLVPTPIWVGLALVFGPIGYLKWRLISAGMRTTIEPMRELGLVADKLLLFCAFCYAFCRAFADHPVWNKGYRDWLKLTPWAPGKRLPLGPVHLVWQDAVALAAFLGLAFVNRSFHPSVVLVAFAFPYLLLTTWSLATGEAGRWSLLILAGLPAVLLRSVTGWWDVLVLALLVPFAQLGTSQLLRRFPWKAGGRIEESSSGESPRDARRWKASAGGMFEALGPVPPQTPTRLWAAAVGSALVGWWAFAGLQMVWPAEVPTAPIAQGIVVMGGLLLGFIRWATYASAYGAPITFRGRLATGRLVIPGYDKILLAPICLVATGAVLPGLALRFGLGVPGTIGLGIAVLLFLVATLPPALGEWKLTGNHHLRSFNRAIAAAAPATRTES
jgi:hypothetical protein